MVWLAALIAAAVAVVFVWSDRAPRAVEPDRLHTATLDGEVPARPTSTPAPEPVQRQVAVGPVAAGPVAGEVVVRVVDACGLAVEGARVSRRDDRDERSLGVTDSAGELRIDAVALHGARTLVAESPWHGISQRELPDDLPQTLELSVGSSIRGQVSVDIESHDMSRIRVLAYAHRAPPTIEGTLAALRDPSAGNVATCDRTGWFELTGLPAGVASFTLVAGGDGFASVESAREVSPCARDVQLALQSVFAVRIRVRDVNGDPVVTSPRLFAHQPPTSRFDDSRARQRASFAPEILLAGLNPELVGKDAETYHRLFIALGPTRASWIGPVRYSVEVPGYGHGNVQAQLIAIRERDATQDCFLDGGVPRCTGALEIVCQGSPIASLSRSRNEGAWATLQLGNESGERYELGLWDLTSEVDRIDGIPCGKYAARLVSTHGFLTLPQVGTQELHIEAHATTERFSIDLSATGALELIESTPPAKSRRQVLVVDLGAIQPVGEDFSVGPIVFERPPYVVPALPPGAYTLEVEGSDGRARPLAAPTPRIEIRAGEVTRCEVLERVR